MVASARLAVEIEIEIDGRWLAEVPVVPGAPAYGRTPEAAAAKAEALALIVADLRVSGLQTIEWPENRLGEFELDHRVTELR